MLAKNLGNEAFDDAAAIIHVTETGGGGQPLGHLRMQLVT